MQALVPDSELLPPTQLAEEAAVQGHAVPAVAVDLNNEATHCITLMTIRH